MGLGFKFWASIVGIAIGLGLAGLILFMVFGWAWYAWGFFGAFVFFSVVAIAIAWVFDKREARRHREMPI